MWRLSNPSIITDAAFFTERFAALAKSLIMAKTGKLYDIEVYPNVCG